MCSTQASTATQAPLVSPTPTPPPFCVSNNLYTVQSGDTCDTIALAKSVSSVDLFNANPEIQNCSTLPVGSSLCLPLTCTTYQLHSDDDCGTASWYAEIPDIKLYNPWINVWCDNLHSEAVVGSVLCASPLGGTYNHPAPPDSTSSFPQSSTGYGTDLTAPPAGHPVAAGTTTLCGKWYTAVAGDTCDRMLLANGINMELFVAANPSVHDAACSTDIVAGTSYCVGPLRMWDVQYLALGCYTNADGPVLGDDVSQTSTSLTVLKCGEFCLLDQGYPVFGIQNGDTCLCDTSLNNGSVSATTACNVPCSGDSGSTCGGGGGAVTVFSTSPELAIKMPISGGSDGGSTNNGTTPPDAANRY